MRDFIPAFCGRCETALSVMVDQHGDYALVCVCPDGTHDLDGEAREHVEAMTEASR